MMEEVKQQVYDLLKNDDSGHGMEHINRVLRLSLRFSDTERDVNKDDVALIALLHDVDDYKIFGLDKASKLTNARRILDDCGVAKDEQERVCLAIERIGYSKRLKGLSPVTIEGKIVSDADMCDALGANGILRVYAYSAKKGRPFFDRRIFPVENVSADEYVDKGASSGVCHIFEKILKLKDLMLTDAGKQEATDRHRIVVEFLHHLFSEEDAPEWAAYLDNYLKNAV